MERHNLHQIELKEQNLDEGAIEAILFSMGNPVKITVLAHAIDKTVAQTKKVLDRMIRQINEDPSSGIQILELEDSYQMATKKQYYEQLIEIARHPAKPKLTEVIMETLSIIAYRQPVTKAEIERIRGVKSDHAVNKLVEYELVQEVGRLDAPGRPVLFGTTERFLRYFGLSTTDQLPEMDAVQMEDFKAEAEAEADRELGTAENKENNNKKMTKNDEKEEIS
jgi:segregation and condensation protein B